MKQTTRVFWKSVGWTALVLSLTIGVLLGMAESYRQMRRIGFDEYKTAVEYHDGLLRVFDWEWRLF